MENKTSTLRLILVVFFIFIVICTSQMIAANIEAGQEAQVLRVINTDAFATNEHKGGENEPFN